MSVQIVTNNKQYHCNNKCNEKCNKTIADGSAFRVYDAQEKTPTKVK